MQYRQLGRTGLKVSEICLGAWRFGTKPDEAASIELVHAALDGGVNFVDTANVYGQGMSEEIVGKALKGRREGVVLATKVRGKMADDPNGVGLSRYAIMRQCEHSLRRLQVDHIDLYQCHFPDDETPIEETMEALNDLVRQGKVRYLGSSNFPAWLHCKAHWAADRHGWSRFVSDQPHYNIFTRKIEGELMPLCEDLGVGILPWSPLAGGFATGKYTAENPPPTGSRYEEGSPIDSYDRLATPENFATLERMRKVGGDHGKAVAQVALRWVLRRPVVSAAIIGASSRDQLSDNLGASDWSLTPEEIDFIDAPS